MYSKPLSITLGIVAFTFSDNLSRNHCIYTLLTQRHKFQLPFINMTCSKYFDGIYYFFYHHHELFPVSFAWSIETPSLDGMLVHRRVTPQQCRRYPVTERLHSRGIIPRKLRTGTIHSCLLMFLLPFYLFIYSFSLLNYSYFHLLRIDFY